MVSGIIMSRRGRAGRGGTTWPPGLEHTCNSSTCVYNVLFVLEMSTLGSCRTWFMKSKLRFATEEGGGG